MCYQQGQEVESLPENNPQHRKEDGSSLPSSLFLSHCCTSSGPSSTAGLQDAVTQQLAEKNIIPEPPPKSPLNLRGRFCLDPPPPHTSTQQSKWSPVTFSHFSGTIFSLSEAPLKNPHRMKILEVSPCLSPNSD